MFYREAARVFGTWNEQQEFVSTGKSYMSYAKMCVAGPCDPRAGLNKNMVCKEVPVRNETRLKVVEGTLLTTAERQYLAANGWIVEDATRPVLKLPHRVMYQGMQKSRGKPPRDDRLTELENEDDAETRREAGSGRKERSGCVRESCSRGDEGAEHEADGQGREKSAEGGKGDKAYGPTVERGDECSVGWSLGD